MNYLRLFDDIPRVEDRPQFYAEPEFRYLNTSARKECVLIRELLEEWFSHYPVEDRADLRAAFHQEIDRQHRAAFFELCLHELFLRLGCRVGVHPSVPGSRRTPDFLVESGSQSFYLEATLATGESEQARGTRARESTVYDAINRIESPNFVVGVTVRGAPSTPPPSGKMCQFLQARLNELEPNRLTSAFQRGGPRAMPQWEFEHDGWFLTFFPIPRSPDRRGLPGLRPLATQIHGAVLNRTDEAIREAVVGKAGRYGQLDRPYVIAVNVLEFPHKDAATDALFGNEQLEVEMTEDGPRGGRRVRIPNGAWIDGKGPRYQRVSAVLIAVRLSPWSLTTGRERLYHNPWARVPCESPLDRLPRMVAAEGLEYLAGDSIGSIFGLPEGWPENLESDLANL